MAASQVQAQAIINAARGTALAAWTPYLSLWIGDPLAGGSEVSSIGTGYARRLITFAAPAGKLAVSSADILFPTPSSGWGTLTHAAFMDASTGGNIRETYLLPGSDTERTVQGGSPAPLFPAGSVTYGVV